MDMEQLKPATQAVVREVLDRIMAVSPEDHERLLKCVRDIVPLPEDEQADGTCGKWVADKLTTVEDFFEFQRYWEEGVSWPGVVYIAEDHYDLPLLLAHEFGHACTTIEDRELQGESHSDEWASEVQANRYAYLWGFDLSRFYDRADWTHHCVKPGDWIEEAIGDDVVRLTVTDDYIIKQVQLSDADREESRQALIPR